MNSNFLKITSALFLTIAASASAASLDDAIDSAKTNNKNIKADDFKLEATKSLKQEARSEFLPSVSVSGQYGQRKSNIRNTSNKYQNNKVEELKLEQPLFNGFGSVAKLNEADYKIQSATQQNQSKKQEISFYAAKTYCDLYRQQEIIKVRDENKGLVNQIYGLARDRFGKKVFDEGDLIKFKYELANAENNYFEAESKLIKAKFEYRNVIGDITNQLALPKIKREKFDEKATVEKAIMTNSNLRSYHFSYLASKSAYSAEKSAFSPTASFVASVSRQKNSLYLGDQQFENRSAYVNVSVPLFQKGVEYSNLSKANNQSRAAREEFQATREDLIKQVGQAIQEYQFYLKLNDSNEQLVALAQDRVAVLQKRFEAKVGDSIEFIRSKIELNEKKVDFINSQMDLVIAYYKLKLFLGEI